MGQSPKLVFWTKVYLIVIVISKLLSMTLLFVDEEPDAFRVAVRGILVWLFWLAFTYSWLNNIQQGFSSNKKEKKFTWPAFMAVTAPFAMAGAIVIWASTYAETAGLYGTPADEVWFLATTLHLAFYEMFWTGYYLYAFSVVLELGVWLVYPIWAVWFWVAAKGLPLQAAEPDVEVFN